MKIIPYTEEMIQKARKKAFELGKLNNSITRGKGNIAGYLGEEAVASYISAKIVSNDVGTDKFNHDLLKDNLRIEVKTKRRTVPPKDFYDVSIAESSLHQKPDLYIFVSLQFKESFKDKNGEIRYKELENVWLLGQKEPDEYLKIAVVWKSGDIDKSNSFFTHETMYNVAIKDLDTINK